jgi:hypothetical protein
MAMVIAPVASSDSAFGCHGNLILGLILEVEKVALSLFGAFAVCPFHAAKEVHIGHQFQECQKILHISLFEFVHASCEFPQLA